MTHMTFFMCPVECSGDGWELHGEKCLKLVYDPEVNSRSKKYTFGEAEELCSTEGGKLATYQTLEDLQLLIDFG